MSPAARAGLVAAVAVPVLVVVAFALGLFEADPVRKPIVVRDAPVPFNLAHDERLRRVPARAPALVRLEGPGLAMTVRPLRLPAYRGDGSAQLTLLAERHAAELARAYPQFLRRGEGRVNINRQQGYQLFFQFRRSGELWYGRRVTLLTSAVSRDGADLLLLARRTPGVPAYGSVGSTGGLKVALRSFRFGTERPG